MIPSLPWNCARSENEITNISWKANRVLGLIQRNLWNCPQNAKEIAHTTLVRPKLLFACSAWDPYYMNDIGAIERVQREAVRMGTCQYDQTADVTIMLQSLKWDTLEKMRKRARLTTMYKMCHGYLYGNWGRIPYPKQRKDNSG